MVQPAEDAAMRQTFKMRQHSSPKLLLWVCVFEQALNKNNVLDDDDTEGAFFDFLEMNQRYKYEMWAIV